MKKRYSKRNFKKLTKTKYKSKRKTRCNKGGGWLSSMTKSTRQGLRRARGAQSTVGVKASKARHSVQSGLHSARKGLARKRSEFAEHRLINLNAELETLKKTPLANRRKIKMLEKRKNWVESNKRSAATDTESAKKYIGEHEEKLKTLGDKQQQLKTKFTQAERVRKANMTEISAIKKEGVANVNQAKALQLPEGSAAAIKATKKADLSAKAAIAAKQKATQASTAAKQKATQASTAAKPPPLPKPSVPPKPGTTKPIILKTTEATDIRDARSHLTPLPVKTPSARLPPPAGTNVSTLRPSTPVQKLGGLPRTSSLTEI
jgi:hypothetical protein